MKNNLLFLVCLFLTISCTQERKFKTTVSTLKKLYGKQIMFFNGNSYYINTKDTVIFPAHDFEYTLVMYADPSECESCTWKLDEWYLKRKEILYYNKSIDFKFILQSSDYEDLEHYLFHAMPNIPIIYDPDGTFIKKNDLPHETKYHTFLLNEKKEIILVGSPIGNDDLWNLYKKTVSKNNN
jgi:hypothetical protein